MTHNFTFSFRFPAKVIQALADALAKMSSEEESVKEEGVAAGAGVAQGGGAAPGGGVFQGGAAPGGAGLGFKVPSLPSSPAGKPIYEAMKYSKNCHGLAQFSCN